MVPSAGISDEQLPLFLTVLMEKLNAKERAALIKAAALTKAEVTACAEAGSRGEEAGARTEERQAAKTVAALSGAGEERPASWCCT